MEQTPSKFVKSKKRKTPGYIPGKEKKSGLHLPPLIPSQVSAFHSENLYVQQHPVLCCFLILCFFGATIIKVVKDT